MIDKTAAELLSLLKQGDVSAVELTQLFLNAIQQRDSQIQAFVRVGEQDALAQAQQVDDNRKSNKPLGKLAGLPIALKDVICIKGRITSCGSRILEKFRPPYDAHVTTRLREADAVIVGQTNMDEFAMGSSTENSAYQKTKNPWDVTRIPGGSSGGSAAAVAACESPVALGSDTGGSVRQPASLCGVVGMKPTYGRVSRYGLIAYGSSLDQIGPVTHDVYDAAVLLETISGHDSRDSTSVDRPTPQYTKSINDPITPLTIGVPREYFAEGLDAEVERSVRDAVKVYEGLGATIREISLPFTKYAISVYYIIATAEASSNLARYDGVHYGHRAAKYDDLIDMMCKSRGEGFGKEVKRRIMLGTHVLSSGYIDAYYLQAMKVRRLIKDDFDKAFAQCDVIMGPTFPTTAFPLGERVNDPLAMYLSDVYTISCNLVGLPGISVPCGFSKDNLPIGLQIIAPVFEEDKLLRIARMHEAQTDWHTKRPPLAG